MKKLILILLTCLVTAVDASAQEPDRNGVILNRRPLTDFGREVSQDVAANGLDLKKPFSISVTSKLTKEGKLDPKVTKVTVDAGSDRQMAKIAQNAVLAVSDSGFLQYLSKLGGTGDIVVKLKQDELNLSTFVSMEMESDTKARTIASSMNTMLSVAVTRAEKKENLQEMVILKNLKLEATEKTVHLLLRIPLEEVTELINSQLRVVPASKP